MSLSFFTGRLRHRPMAFALRKDRGKKMKSKQRRITLTLGVLSGGLFAAAFLPMAPAVADQFDLTPDTTSFDPSQVEGYPPLFNDVTGSESWNVTDLTTNSVSVSDFFKGVDTVTTFGSFTNDD